MKLKSILTVLTVAILSILPAGKVKAQIKFIDYKTTTFDNVLKKAQAENKNIYVDIWTTWCGVCKMMDRWIFPRKDVSDYFNKNFVNLTFDAENPQWASIAKKFNATAFPTMLILNPKGEVILNIDNLGVPQESDATSATSSVGNRLIYQAGMANKLESMPDTAFASKENATALAKLTPAFDTKVFSRIITLKDAFQKSAPKEFNHIVDEALGSAAVNMINKDGHTVNTHKEEQYRSVVESLDLPQKQTQLLQLDLNLAIATRQWKQALSLVEKKKSAMNPILYATLMDGFSEQCKNKVLLRSAVKISANAVDSVPEDSRLKNYLKEAYANLKEAAK